MQFYELATLTLPFGTASKAGAAVADFAREGAGRFLGAWTTDIGKLNRMIVLRGFADAGALMAERQRVLESASPFGCGAFLTEMALESYVPFPFMKPVEPGNYGAVYEIRTYRFRTGGLPHTVRAWEAALPGREAHSRCLIAMHALDGVPRFTQLWPYADLAARAKARRDSVAAGVWPPKGGPDWLTTEMESVIGLPVAGSPPG
jgi:hypothetical protein